jgi:hypothetical protein
MSNMSNMSSSKKAGSSKVTKPHLSAKPKSNPNPNDDNDSPARRMWRFKPDSRGFRRTLTSYHYYGMILFLALLIDLFLLSLLERHEQVAKAEVILPVPGSGSDGNGGFVRLPSLAQQPVNDKINIVMVCKDGRPFRADWLKQALNQRNAFDLGREIKRRLGGTTAPNWYFATDPLELYMNKVPFQGREADLMGATEPFVRIGNIESTATHFRAYELPSVRGSMPSLAIAVSQEATDLGTMANQLGRGRIEHPLTDLNDTTQRFTSEEIIAGLKARGAGSVAPYRQTPYGPNVAVPIDHGNTTYNGAVRLIVVDCSCFQ